MGGGWSFRISSNLLLSQLRTKVYDMQRNYLLRSFILTMLIAIGLQTLLTGCVPKTSSPTQVTTVSKSPSPTLLVDNTSVSTFASVTKFVDIPDNCNLADLSHNFKWIAIYCGKAFEVAEVGSAQWIPLFQSPKAAVVFSPDSTKLLAWSTTTFVATFELFDVNDWYSHKFLLNSPSAGTITWSPDSQSVAISYLNKGFALSILHLNGTVDNLLTYADVGYEFGDGSEGFGPAWSPDSKNIAYVHPYLSETLPVQINTVEVATGKKRLLYSGRPGEVASYPVWSPDGRMISIHTLFPKEPYPVYIYDTVKNALTGVRGLPFDYGTVWSPDSKYIAGCDDKNRLHILSVLNNQDIVLDQDCSTFLVWKGPSQIIIYLGTALYLISFL